MIEKTYKIPEGSEAIVDNMVQIGVERFLKIQLSQPPVEEKVEYQQAVDSFRTENAMELKYSKVEVKPIEEPIEEPIKDSN
jgi:hypothetical protein